MFKKMIAEYENDLINASSKEERDRLEIEIFENFIQPALTMDRYGEFQVTGEIHRNREKYQAFIESDLIVTWLKSVMDKDSSLHRAVVALVSYVTTDKAKENARRIADETKEYLIDENRRKKIRDSYDALDIDVFFTDYLDLVEKLGEPIDERVLEFAKEFYNNLPGEYGIVNSLFFNKYWLPRHESDERIAGIFQKKSKEQYVEMLSSLESKRSGKVDEFFTYDNILAEYFTFYLDELPCEEVERYLKVIDENTVSGDIISSSSINLLKNHPTGMEAMRRNPGIIFNDILRQFHASDGRIADLRTPIHREVFEHMVSKNPQTNRTYAEDYIASLSDNDHIGIRIVNNLINLKNAGYRYSRYELTPFIRKMMEFVEDTNIYDSLVMNFDEGKLYDTSVDEKGLTNFDYADIALGLVGNANLYEGIREIRDEETKHLYERHGRDLYTSKAIRALVTRYVDEFRNKRVGSHEELERICLDFVRTASRKPEFDLFKDQECSDILQLAKVGKNDFVRRLEEEMQQGMRDNPEYNMSKEEATVYVRTFMTRVGERAIGEELEPEFDRFLKALSIMKINDEHGAIPQDINEFLIRQAMNEESIMNSKEHKYSGAFERVIENYALNDAILEGTKPEDIPLYFIRDFLGMEAAQGRRGSDDIVSKRSSIISILDGKMNGFDTICHENTHLGQPKRMSRFAVDTYYEYMMAKEEVISGANKRFYSQNYDLMYIEIDAREKAAEKVVALVDNVLTPKIAAKLVHGMSADIVRMFEDKYDKIKQKYSEKSDKERDTYQFADKKNYRTEGESVHAIFDELLTSAKIAKAVKLYPALACEYKEDGTKRTISEQLDFMREHRKELRMPVMGQILTNTKDERKDGDRDAGFFEALGRWSSSAETVEEVDLVNTVISNVVPSEITKFWSNQSSQYYLDVEEGYRAYKGIDTVLKSTSDERFTGFNKVVIKGKTPLDLLNEAKAGLEARFPEFAERLQSEPPQYVQQYDELRRITAHPDRMHQVAQVEENGFDKDDEHKSVLDY